MKYFSVFCMSYRTGNLIEAKVSGLNSTLSIFLRRKVLASQALVFNAVVFEHHIENPTFEKSRGGKQRPYEYSHLALIKMAKVDLKAKCPPRSATDLMSERA
jgi:hypothetical protein